MTRGRDRGAHFRGVVRIVVDHIDALLCPQSLESPLDTAERGESRRHSRYRAPQREPGAEGGHRVADVVQSRHRQLDRPQILPVETHLEARAHRIQHQIRGHQARIGRVRRRGRAGCRGAVSNHLVTRRNAQGHGPLVISAAHHHACRCEILLEGAHDVIEIAIDVEVIGLDIQDDRHRRIEREERAVVLIGFDHVGVAAESQVPGPQLDATTDDAGGFASGGRQRFGGHHGRGGLAVGPGDADQRAATDGVGQRFGPSHQRNPGGTRGDHFRVRRGDGRRIDDRPRAGHERGIVAGHRDAVAREIGGAGGIRIGTLNTHAATGQQFSEGTHTGTGDPDEVHGARIGAIEQHGSRQRWSAGTRIGDGAGIRRRHAFNMATGSSDPYRTEAQGPNDRRRDLGGGAGAGSRERGLMHGRERGPIIAQGPHGGI